MLELQPVDLAGFVLHELTHRRLFVPGEIEFNETLASAVSVRLTEQFFAEKGDEALLKRALRRHAGWLDEAHACDALAERLEAYFAAPGRWPSPAAGHWAMKLPSAPNRRIRRLPRSAT